MKAIEEAIGQYSGCAFGVHRYTNSKRLKDGRLVGWAEIRRQFWGIILIALSIS